MSQKSTNPHMAKLRSRVAKAPTKPGIYRWLSEKGDILYIGKAKNLRERMRSYVSPTKDKTLGPWKLSLLDQIADFEITTTATELEALILETNLIKENKPKYNVLMKDDKNYVYVRFTLKDPFPTTEVLRLMEDDDATYFGPFLGSQKTERTLKILDMIYRFRACKESIEQRNRNPDAEITNRIPCLEYQIKRCNGLCIGSLTQEEYGKRISKIDAFFRGDRSTTRKVLQEEMQIAATDKKFERAAKLRDALTFIEALDTQQIVSGTTGENTDAIGIALHADKAQVVLLRERDGKVIEELSFALMGSAETIADVAAQFIPQYYSQTADFPDTILLAEDVPEIGLLEDWLKRQRGRKVEVRIPERGKKNKLLEMAEKNAMEKIEQQYAKWEAEAKNRESALAQIAQALDLKSLPKRIEGYDISHLGGTETVGSMVVFRNGAAANDHYRSFTLRTVQEGEIDDYKSLEEVLRRRLLHLVHNVRQEEKIWNDKGIIFGKVRKAEHEFMRTLLKDNPGIFDPPIPDMKTFLVARKGETIIACSSLRDLDGTSELTAVWVRQEFRGNKLGQFLCRKHLSSVKKGKVYLLASPKLQRYYTDIGFRHIYEAPKPIQKLVELNRDESQEPMMFDALQNKPDVSFTTLPDLLLIDGGKGQLSSAVKVLQELDLDIPVISLAKRAEEVFTPNIGIVPMEEQAQFLLQRIRDEAHRFSNRHREKRGIKAAKSSALDMVPGIGEKTRSELLRKFGSVSIIKEAGDEDLLQVVNTSQLRAIRETL